MNARLDASEARFDTGQVKFDEQDDAIRVLWERLVKK